MPRYILKLRDRYLEWSTIVDAPVTDGMTLDEFRDYYRSEYGEHGMTGLDARLERVEKNGTSAMVPHHNIDYLISTNRAGPNETCLTEEELYREYCQAEAGPGGTPRVSQKGE